MTNSVCARLSTPSATLISVDTSQFAAACADLPALAAALPEGRGDAFLECLFGILDRSLLGRLLKIETHRTLGADELVAVALPSDGLRAVMSALRAGDGELAIEHLMNSVVASVATPTIEVAGAGVESASALEV